MVKNVAEMFVHSSVKFGHHPAYYTKDKNKNFQPLTYSQVYEKGRAFSEGLIALGVKARDNVALLADNRLEWIIADMGVLMAGAADVPRGTDITDSEIIYILTHCGAKVLIVENQMVYEKYLKNKAKINNIKDVIFLDPPEKLPKGTYSIEDIQAKGEAVLKKGKGKVEERIEGILPDDIFTIIYTSGTTGTPKGVMLKHSSMIHQLTDVAPIIGIEAGKERLLSILPVWHIFQRYMEYVGFFYGASSYYSNIRDLRDDFAKAKPTFMASAPRLWENIYNGIYNKVRDPKQTPAVRRVLFSLAYFFSKNWHASVRFFKGNLVDYTDRSLFESGLLAIRYGILGLLTGPFTLSTVSFLLYAISKQPSGSESQNLLSNLCPVFLGIGILSFVLNHWILDRVVLSKIRQATGGHLKASLSGGGALPGHVDAFFNDIGMKVIEGYGMTETSPVISARTFQKLIIGSVGCVVPGCELQIRAENGEVLTHINSDGNILAGKRGQRGVVFVTGPLVMKGYYKNEETTAKTIVNGWMNTGDMGMINFKNTLTLTGRAKDTIVLLGGENVEPVPIENKICESPYVSQCMVVGQDQKVLGVLIVPDVEKVKDYCLTNSIPVDSIDKLILNSQIQELFKKEVKMLNNTKVGFKSFEQVQPIELISKPFEIGDELTNLMKMKRHVITEKYKDKIKKMFS